jgi:hypothetical protein
MTLDFFSPDSVSVLVDDEEVKYAWLCMKFRFVDKVDNKTKEERDLSFFDKDEEIVSSYEIRSLSESSLVLMEDENILRFTKAE